MFLPISYYRDFGSEFLRCDCNLRWVLAWAKSKKVRLGKDTICALPSPMQGRLLKKLDADDLYCGKLFQIFHVQIIYQVF